ncbi:CoA transferase subunit A [Natrialbaceae archaeon A-CW2]
MSPKLKNSNREDGKVTDLSTAVTQSLSDGDSVYLAGFTHLIPFAAGHEIIRQGFTGLHLIRATPDLIYDQMIAAGCASKITFSWAGNPGVGSLRAFRRAIEDSIPRSVELDEYTHFGLTSRLAAGARGLPFMPVRTFEGSDLPDQNENIRAVKNPFGEDKICTVPPLCPDVAVVRAQRADSEGNAHIWGIQGEIPEVAHAADTVILSVEEIVEERVIRSDPNRTVVPGTAVDYVVEEPYGSHPSYAQGYYDRDNDAYLEWNEVSGTHEDTLEWLDEWVYGVADRQEYIEKLGAERLLELQVSNSYAAPINMGGY